MNQITAVTLIPLAVTNDRRRLTMATDPQNSGGASALVQTFESNGLVHNIPSVTLDDIFSTQAVDQCKLLKIDCEGMEYEILYGAGVLNKIERLAGEFHTSPRLTGLGYRPDRLLSYCSTHLDPDKVTVQFNTIPG